MEITNIKKQAHELIDKLPENFTWEDLMYQIYVRQSVEAGLADIQAGKTIDVREIRKQFGLLE